MLSDAGRKKAPGTRPGELQQDHLYRDHASHGVRKIGRGVTLSANRYGKVTP
jgi:hypothetical protein